MKDKKGKEAVLQIPADFIKQDSDGYYLFPLPLIAYVQQLDGEPIDKKGYIRLKIDCEGKVKKELT